MERVPVEGPRRMNKIQRRLCVFCGSKAGSKEVYTLSARRFGKAMVERGLGLVYGGGHIGLMGILAEDVFASLPGGFGTADELFEILTWSQLHYHAKPVGILNVDGFFDPQLTWLDRAVVDGFLKLKHRRLLIEAREPEELLDRLWVDNAIRKGP